MPAGSKPPGAAIARSADGAARRPSPPPLDQLEIVKGADKLTLYQWGTNTARHYFCSVCGIYTHHQRRSDPTHYGVNLGCIEGVNPRDHEPIGWVDGVNHPSDR